MRSEIARDVGMTNVMSSPVVLATLYIRSEKTVDLCQE